MPGPILVPSGAQGLLDAAAHGVLLAGDVLGVQGREGDVVGDAVRCSDSATEGRIGRRRYRVAVRPRLDQVVIDSRQPASLARFWAALLDGLPVDRARGWSHVDAAGFPRLSFQPVPEPKATKNRLHLDIEVDPGDLPAAVAAAVDLGAVPVGELVTDDKGSFHVMRDPEGNEFCFVSA